MMISDRELDAIVHANDDLAAVSPHVATRDDHTYEYGELASNHQERIEGIDPATGKPDSRFDSTITVSVPAQRTPAVHDCRPPAPDRLVEAVRSTDLLIARDLGVGLAELAEDERLRSQAAELRRSLEERYR